MRSRSPTQPLTGMSTSPPSASNPSWGGTPGLRSLWSSSKLNSLLELTISEQHKHVTIAPKPPQSTSLLENSGDADAGSDPPLVMETKRTRIKSEWKATAVPFFDPHSSSYQSIQENENENDNRFDLETPTTKPRDTHTLSSPSMLAKSLIPTSTSMNDVFYMISKVPSVLIGVLLNLFLGISFGSAFFPSTWTFPPDIPHTIGIQMFLFSTIVCQVVMTLYSDFPCSMGMQMVENVPFMHTIANAAIEKQGMGRPAFATTFVAFAISSLFVGTCFYFIGRWKNGSFINAFPRNVIVGCIGGIGVFIFQTGLEISTGRPFKWDGTALEFFNPTVMQYWVAALCLEILLRLIQHVTQLSLLPPFYFIAIPPCFYILLWSLNIKPHEAQAWFFPQASSPPPSLIFELIDFRLVDWSVIISCLPTIVALTVFAFMHVPVNIPSLKISTGLEADINKELVAHGISNLLTGCLGGLQNYLCYSNSVLYFKCGGNSRIGGLFIAAVTAVFFVIGPSLVHLCPRLMPGCLLLHVGIDLTREALWDSLQGFDVYEYCVIVTLTGVMSIFGMTTGLMLGAALSALTFVLQTSNYVKPIRRKLRASTLKSTKWRTPLVSVIHICI